MTDYPLFGDVNEQQRLATLDGFNILDTAPEAGFDDIVLLAQDICDTPIALVSFVAANRQWFKAVVGLESCETPLEQSVCWYALKQDRTLIIPDLTQDDRTKTNSLVTEAPHIRFYAGALLKTTSGIGIGTLCVIDTKPRPQGLTDRQQASLEALARQVMMQLELRRAMSVGETAFSEQRAESTALEARAIESERLSAMLRANEARLRMAQEAGKVGTFEIDVASNAVAASEEFCRIYGLPMRSIFDASDLERLVHPEDAHLISSKRSRQDGSFSTISEYRIRKADTGETAWILRRAQLLREASGDVTRAVGTVQDVTERKEAEARQKILNEELSHRMKNTLALVQAIASQTLRNASDQNAVQAFAQRITALSQAHDVLLQQSWLSARMREVLKGVLGLHANESRFSVSGPTINLGPKTTLSLSLLLHELATNAVKYGALSLDTGHVAIEWSKTDTELVLSWIETGGPPSNAPTKKGLGSRLISMGLSGTSDVVTRYEQSGFSAQFKAPLALIEH